jgi:hypothetical protein
MPSMFITQTNRYGYAVGTTQTVTDDVATALVEASAAIPSANAQLPTNTPSWFRDFINTIQAWVQTYVSGAAVMLTGTQTVAGQKTFSAQLSVSSALSRFFDITAPSGRIVVTTASLAAHTLAQSKATTVLTSPASAITVTLAAPLGDGERRRIVFGAATTVTWAVTAPATTTTALKTSFAAGESIELVYNSTAGTPANSTATTWYPH